ncbi:MAG TPA: YdcF family protein [Pyrinomonadaceae bacterium]
MSRRLKAAIIILALFIAWIVTAPLLAENLIVEKTLERADAALVLGGSSTYVERTRKAAEIYRAGVVPKILLTDDGERGGWSRIEKRNPPFVELARDSLISGGVPANNIEILKPQVSGTIDEARALLNKSQTEKLDSVLLVTSAYHTRRALRTFEKQFADRGARTELGIVAAPVGEQTPLPNYWWLSRRGWNLVAGEYLKIVGYWAYY